MKQTLTQRMIKLTERVTNLENHIEKQFAENRAIWEHFVVNEKQVDQLRKEHDLLGDAHETLAWDTEKRLQKLEKRLDDKCKGWHIFTMGASKCDRCGIENPSTAMRSTGAIKREDKIKEKLKEYFTNHLGLDRNLDEIAGRILEIVKGE